MVGLQIHVHVHIQCISQYGGATCTCTHICIYVFVPQSSLICRRWCELLIRIITRGPEGKVVYLVGVLLMHWNQQLEQIH